MTREHQFIPELIVPNGPAALEFYKAVGGAQEVDPMMTADSQKLVHGELTEQSREETQAAADSYFAARNRKSNRGDR